MISCDLLVQVGSSVIIFFTTAKIYLLSSSEYCLENQNTDGLTHDINNASHLNSISRVTHEEHVQLLF